MKENLNHLYNLGKKMALRFNFHALAQNGRIKRKHRHVVESSPTLLTQTHMPLSSQWEAFQVVVYLINRIPSSTIGGKFPYFLSKSQDPNYTIFKTFGSTCYLCLGLYQQHKFDFHTEKCVLCLLVIVNNPITLHLKLNLV